MSWRNDPDSIWEERLGRLRVEVDPATGQDLVSIEDRYGSAAFWKPDTVEDRIEATERWLAAMGLEADDIREAPKPIEVGDIVKLGHFEVLYRVRHIDGDAAFLRRVSNDAPFACMVNEVVLVDGPAPEPEPGWIITRDPNVLAAAIDAGRTVEMSTVDGWSPTAFTSGQFRARAGERMSVDYRYEGPALTLGGGDDR